MCHLLRRRKYTTDINGCEQRSGKKDACVFITFNTPLTEI